MAQLTEWLKLMVAEIHRKREDAEIAKQEETARQAESAPPKAAKAEA
ncbi:MAG: hypothetical protein WDO56_01405 [Gammaproteobacteria bacterium]